METYDGHPEFVAGLVVVAVVVLSCGVMAALALALGA